MKYLILLLLLVGCAGELVCEPKTITNEVIVFQNVTIPGNCSVCEECLVINNSGLINDLKLCNIALEDLGEEYGECVMQDDADYLYNLTRHLDDCVEDRDRYKSKLDNITEALK